MFFFCGNNFVAIEMTPNLRCKSDNVLYFVRCLSRRYIHSWPSLYPCLAVAVSTLCIRFLKKNANLGIRRSYSHALPSLYPHLAVAVSTLCISLKKIKIQTPGIAMGMLYMRWADYTCSQFPFPFKLFCLHRKHIKN